MLLFWIYLDATYLAFVLMKVFSFMWMLYMFYYFSWFLCVVAGIYLSDVHNRIFSRKVFAQFNIYREIQHICLLFSLQESLIIIVYDKIYKFRKIQYINILLFFHWSCIVTRYFFIRTGFSFVRAMSAEIFQ